jgi:hypothetical protein
MFLAQGGIASHCYRSVVGRVSIRSVDIAPLADPVNFGGDPADAFMVVAPPCLGRWYRSVLADTLTTWRNRRLTNESVLPLTPKQGFEPSLRAKPDGKPWQGALRPRQVALAVGPVEVFLTLRHRRHFNAAVTDRQAVV